MLGCNTIALLLLSKAIWLRYELLVVAGRVSRMACFRLGRYRGLARLKIGTLRRHDFCCSAWLRLVGVEIQNASPLHHFILTEEPSITFFDL
jgi:hypothetical protein